MHPKIKMLQSPLNYTGGKFKLLPQILPLFPQKINTFVDLFCGGCNVGINVEAEKHVYNDINLRLIYLFHTLKNLNKGIAFEMIYEIIDKYGLSLVSRHGYEYYGCESGKGLGTYNKERFLSLREDFNRLEVDDYYYYIMLYVLIVYAFNNQIRFNSDGKFNLPVGKRDFNAKMAENLSAFIDVIKKQDSRFTNNDFENFDAFSLNSDDFVYIDPPYLIACAAYNEQNAWNEDREQSLLNFIDELTDKKVKCALSNVLQSKGKQNNILSEWLEKNSSKYFVHRLNYSYANSNYHTKDRTDSTEEILVTNYEEDETWNSFGA